MTLTESRRRSLFNTGGRNVATITWVRSQARRLLGPSFYDEVAVVHGLIGRRPGVMVDVGAHHGTSLAPFAADRWTVYAFEPDPTNRAELIRRTKHLPNVSIVDRAISEVDGEKVTLYTSDVSSGISTLTPFHESHQAATEVITVRLDSWIKECRIAEVTFLKVDTEGHDLPVLRTFPWDSHRPAVVVCEFENRKTLRLGYSTDDLAQFLVMKGYAVLVSEWHPVVEYGRAHQWRNVHPYPGQLGSEAAWGNLVAVEPEFVSATQRGLRLAGRRLKIRQRVDSALCHRPFRWLTSPVISA